METKPQSQYSTFMLILFLVLMVYVLRKMTNENKSKGKGINTNSTCEKPDFPEVLLNARDCRGSVIDESRVMQLGSYGCDVVVLQQRLNNLERTYILKPSGFFDCATLEKLRRVKKVAQISLSNFQADEQIGMDSFTPMADYSTQRYMDEEQV